MEPRLVSFAEMRKPEVIGQIGEEDQFFLLLSHESLEWNNYVVEMAFIPAVRVESDRIVRPSLKDLSTMSKKFEKIILE